MTRTDDADERPAPTALQISVIKRRAAMLSVMATILLTAAKVVAALISGSLALLTDALQGLVDIGSTLFTWFAVHAADKPADEEHHYGHGKLEALAALVETAILFTRAAASSAAATNCTGDSTHTTGYPEPTAPHLVAPAAEGRACLHGHSGVRTRRGRDMAGW